ncbi:S41 family peptidase [Chryseobacterium sp. MFBS3-17]|uniref:S41 family peptidase n=1 Tax=Chryseobacterium sp. MFBS3-17 TaxID=2886689 RepID=UPI001D0DE4C4|nr:S41 family peptidase [Chryseobacterium sp. MFBS3-17]MCC2589346.1 peptidase S41 [Chryseobacterium sp. MFBS3-17]
MKNLFCIAVLLWCTSCVSVKTYNERLETPLAPEKLHQDTDYAYQKLQKLHPELYWYISKEELDEKFARVKAGIDQPLNPAEFYTRLAPVISEVKQGHLRLVPPSRRLTRAETRDLEKQKGLLSRYNFLVDGDRIFVKDNADQIPDMNVGTEILSIKDIPVKELLAKYRPWVNSDGENQTFQKYSMARRWPVFFTLEHGILDSVKLETLYKNEIKTFYLQREKMTKEELKKEEAQNKKLTQSQPGKVKDYNIRTRSFNRNLQFPTADSTIAYMKIKTFSGRHSRKFYKQSFEILKNSPAEHLILDVRDNLGGSLSEINNLYSYLVEEEFRFIKDIEVTSRSAMFQAAYFSQIPRFIYPVAAAVYPVYLAGTALSVKQKDGRFYLRNNGTFALKKPKDNNFKGKIYVLVNGSSFSAASILPAKLKGEGRAMIIGEETGGANDGTVAGRYARVKLPHSRLGMPTGLMLIQPDIPFSLTKKGVIPHHEIVPTPLQVLAKKDIQLEWVMEHIKAQAQQPFTNETKD